MNMLEKFIYLLQTEMETPKLFGWFHILCISLTLIIIIILYKNKHNYNEKKLKYTLGTYSITAFILELLKQVSWSFNYNKVLNIVTWDYQWYAFPFQLCTTPIYVCLLCMFLKKGKMRTYLLSYISFITILGSISTIIYPTSCFTSDILVNIHTMWLHCGSLVISIYLLVVKEVKIKKENFIHAFIVFIIFALFALILNYTIYNANILNGETFNMFYISPYFISVLPIFDTIQKSFPYIYFLFIYIFVIFTGGLITYYISKLFVKKYN